MGKARSKRIIQKPKQESTLEPFEILDYENHLTVMFPKSTTQIIDYDGRKIDKARHPFVFINNNDNFDEFLGFKITSHPPRQDELKEFFFVTIKHPDEITYTDPNKIKETSFIHCSHIDKYEGYVYKAFDTKGQINKKKYQEIMSEVLTKHILLQEERLVTMDNNTDVLLDNLCLTREEIIASPRYQRYHDKLHGLDLRPTARQSLEVLIAMERDKVRGQNKK